MDFRCSDTIADSLTRSLPAGKEMHSCKIWLDMNKGGWNMNASINQLEDKTTVLFYYILFFFSCMILG